MPRTVSIGAQSFPEIREHGYFLVDKTGFVRDWWESGDAVTLICRPRRFGKTLNMSMVEAFFSHRYAERADLFDGLEVWRDKPMRTEQGTWPVLALSFGGVKARTFAGMCADIRRQVARVLRGCWPEGSAAIADPVTKQLVREVEVAADDETVQSSLGILCEALQRESGRKVIVLLDEYDTPLQEAWLQGYWEDASGFMRGLLNETFKTNPFLERGLLTGITRIAHESIFSDLNNLKVVTATSDEYASAFGFTEAEVFAAMDEYGLADRVGVRRWYDGFSFGRTHDVYNPWSITNYLDTGKLEPYWANTSGNALVSTLVGGADALFKSDFEVLLSGGTVTEHVEEQTTFSDLDRDSAAVWGLLVSSGYLCASAAPGHEGDGVYRLAITNYETMLAFEQMVRRWFSPVRVPYNEFVRALLAGDTEAMTHYLNDVALDTFSVFDTGKRPSGTEPERFYHGFVLGLLVELRGRYRVRSNRESGYGRYDVLLEPADASADDGIILEFKVRDPERESSLGQCVDAALAQIEEKHYATELVAQGLPQTRVHSYGIAFEGKRALVGGR